MSKTPNDPLVPSVLSFHAFAEARGDGLHPALAAALRKSGATSGPPAAADQVPDTVVRADFLKKTSAPGRKQA